MWESCCWIWREQSQMKPKEILVLETICFARSNTQKPRNWDKTRKMSGPSDLPKIVGNLPC